MPFTDGVICNKVAQDMGGVRARAAAACCTRCAAAARRAPGHSSASPGTQALDEIHARTTAVIDRWGPQAVTPLNYAGPHGMLSGDSMSSRFFHKLGASQLYRRSLCGGVRSEAWAGTYGAVPGCPPEFAEHAQLNVVWGNNATVANLHLVRCIRRAMRKGGRLVVVDPLRTKIAEQADLHLALLPGTDMLLAWSLAAELERAGAFDAAFIAAHVLGFDEFMARARAWPAARAAEACGVPEAQIVTLARMAGGGRSAGAGAGQRPGTRAQRRQRHPRRDRAAGVARQARARAAASCSAPAMRFRKTMARLQRPDLVPAGTRTLNLIDVGRHLAATTSIRRCARCSSTTTIRSSCIRTRTACAAAWRATTCSPSAST